MTVLEMHQIHHLLTDNSLFINLVAQREVQDDPLQTLWNCMTIHFQFHFMSPTLI